MLSEMHLLAKAAQKAQTCETILAASRSASNTRAIELENDDADRHPRFPCKLALSFTFGVVMKSRYFNEVQTPHTHSFAMEYAASLAILCSAM
jgi:hypothetical protein